MGEAGQLGGLTAGPSPGQLKFEKEDKSRPKVVREQSEILRKQCKNDPQRSENDSEQPEKRAQNRSENSSLADGPIASDGFQTFGSIWNLILQFCT